MIKRIIDFSHQLLEESVKKGETVIDATAGNGNDTIFLSRLVGETGQVLAFDIQEEAILAVNDKLKQQQIENTRVIHDGHEHVATYLEDVKQISGVIFNLGYLPGSDKSIITQAASTIKALDVMLGFLKKAGVIVLVVYHGHPGGKQERDALLEYTARLHQKTYNVLQYGFINQKNSPPFIVAIEKK